MRDEDATDDELDEDGIVFGDICRKTGGFTYEYDFGSSWLLSVIILKRRFLEPPLKYPVAVRGVGASPPEDIGGIAEYNEMLAILGDPTHQRFQEVTSLISPFDFAATNAMLQQLT